MKGIREWPSNFLFSVSTENKECRLQILDSVLPLVGIFFDTKHKSQEQGVEHKALSRSRFRAQSQVSRAACMERTPVCGHKSYPRAGLRSRHCAKRQLSGTGVLEMSYLRAGSVPNSMSSQQRTDILGSSDPENCTAPGYMLQSLIRPRPIANGYPIGEGMERIFHAAAGQLLAVRSLLSKTGKSVKEKEWSKSMDFERRRQR